MGEQISTTESFLSPELHLPSTDNTDVSHYLPQICGTFHGIANNHDNIAIPPILVPSVGPICHYVHFLSLHYVDFLCKLSVSSARLCYIPYNLAIKSSLESFSVATFQWISPLPWYKHPDINNWCLIQTSVNSCCFSVPVAYVLFVLFQCFLYNYWPLYVTVFMAFLVRYD